MSAPQERLYAALSANHQPVTDHIVHSVAQTGDFYTHWKRLAKQLKVSEAEVVRFEERCGRDQSEMCLVMLNAWRGREQEQADVSRLAKASMQTGRFVMLEVLNRACIPS